MRHRLAQMLPWVLLFVSTYWLGSHLVGHKHEGRYIWSDAEGYFMYLPAVFTHGGFENLPVRTPYQFKKYPGTDKVFTKYTCGVAVLEAPFFLGAMASRKIQGFDAGKYAAGDYSVGLLLAGCFYGVLGLWLVFRSLRREFGEKVPPVLTLAVMLLGTNLLHYMVTAPGMSHVYSFFLIALLVYITPKLYEGGGGGEIFLTGRAAFGVDHPHPAHRRGSGFVPLVIWCNLA